MLRILHVIATLDRAGAEGQLTRLCLRLNRREFQPAVCCLTRGGPYEQELRAAGVPVTVLGKRGRYDLRMLARLMALVRRWRPDILHTWLFTSNTWGRLAGWLAGAPVLIASERAADRWKGRFHKLADRRLAAISSTILANCEAVKRFCVEEVGVPAEKFRVIRNGLNLSLFDQSASAAPEPGPERRARVLVGTVARLEPQKGLPQLLEALRVLHSANAAEAELWIVGDGPDRGKLEAVVASSPDLSQSVRFLGRRSDVPALLRQLDIFVLSSLWEGLPNAVMEAMAARLPVAATAVDGTPELVVEGETGLLVPPRSAEALAQALAKLAADPSLRQRMGEAGRERIERDFSEDRMVREYESLYRELAKPARPARPTGRRAGGEAVLT